MERQKSLEVKNLKISFRTNGGKVQAVRDISFDLYKGETLAIVGESGSGKSVTSKAVLGIQAANAIYEGGEILYDGQDLLKISEEDFYKLRGDKVAMIFQDPLSSLNPIMRIGKQLTEAMLLKGKARQKACRAEFGLKLDYLKKNMLEALPGEQKKVEAYIELFRSFEALHTRMEGDYNIAIDNAKACTEEAESLLLRLSKNVRGGENAVLKKIKNLALAAEDEFVISGTDEEKVDAYAKTYLLEKDIADIKYMMDEAIAREAPDFFALAYARFKGKESRETDMPLRNEENRRVLAEGFLNEFTRMTRAAVAHNEAKFAEKRKQALEELRAAREAFAKSLDGAEIKQTVKRVCEKVDACIDRMDIVKDSAIYTYSGSLKDFYGRYLQGKRKNGPKQRKYEKQMAKYNAILAKGKEPDYKVAMPSIVDLEQMQTNMVVHTDNLIEHLSKLQGTADEETVSRKADALLEYLKENASGMVFRVTSAMAKQRALKLMAEVGIPEPEKRYRAYPFEFSGGMRQRIVIAIALAANPDVLICDEPTTALDVTIQAQILELINKLKKERNLSIIFITHDLGVVANMADRIAVMYAGKIVEYGTAEDVFYTPAHPYTWALLSSMPDLDTKEKLEAIPGTPPDMLYPPVGDAFAARNKYAMEIDFEQQPPRFDISETHWAATWLLHPNAPKVDPPEVVTQRIERMRRKNAEQAAAREEESV